jgi:hypothetical protein
MGLGANTSNNKETDQSDEPKFHEHKSWSDWADIAARWVVDLFAIPISFITAILAQRDLSKLGFDENNNWGVEQ